MHYTVIKHDGHLRTRGKCRKHEPQASVFHISTFSLHFLHLCRFYTHKTLKHAFSMFYTLIKLNMGFWPIRAPAGSYLYFKWNYQNSKRCQIHWKIFHLTYMIFNSFVIWEEELQPTCERTRTASGRRAPHCSKCGKPKRGHKKGQCTWHTDTLYF